MNIDQQIELERNMIANGREAYLRTVEKAVENGRAHETASAGRLMREAIVPIAEALEAWVNEGGAGRQGKIKPLLKLVKPENAAFIALQCVFGSFTRDDLSITSAGLQIGRRIEDELRFQLFEIKHADYYDELRTDFKRKGTKSYQHKHRVLTHKANEFEDGWQSWTPSELAAVGVKMIDFVLEATDFIEKVQVWKSRKLHTMIQPTEQAMEWVRNHNEQHALLNPERMPCIIEPDDWTSVNQGGYYTPELRTNTPMLKTYNKSHRKYVNRHDLTHVFEAINHNQKVGWTVNKRMLEIAQLVWQNNLQIGMPSSEKLVPTPSPWPDVPVDQMTELQRQQHIDWKQMASKVYTKEKERVAKSFQTSRIIRTAAQYAMHDTFWYVWTADFRGRMYTATAGFSPQGPDLAKGLLAFRERCALGPHGFYWMRVNIANRYGFDKSSYDARVAWVDERSASFRAAARDPLSHRNVWSGADKPWQFLAALVEYDEACTHAEHTGTFETFASYLPCGLDGSCNGLQNFSAMLRDAVGGAATNLVPASVPSDIYAEVARVCARKLHGILSNLEPDDASREIWHLWRSFCDNYGSGTIPRSLAKRPVMTMPYGATRQSCTEYIFDSIMEIAPDHFTEVGVFEAAKTLTPVLWKSIGDVVIAARQAMDWLQKASGAVSRDKDPIMYVTPDGFPVWQAQFKTEEVRVRTQLAGDFRLVLRTYTDQIDSAKQRNAVAPNYVHSMDATHLRETVRICRSLGITSLSTIHDDYGTHAGNTGVLHQAIRRAFVNLYEVDALGDFKKQLEYYGHELPELPSSGSLDIQQVMASPYFFG